MKSLEVKENRKRLGLTQKDLAKLIGVSLKTISNYEKGEVIPDSKKELLRSVLLRNKNDLVSEPSEGYEIFDKFEEQILQIKEKIKEHNEIIKLLITPDKKQTKATINSDFQCDPIRIRT